jgi:hypothetical protein
MKEREKVVVSCFAGRCGYECFTTVATGSTFKLIAVPVTDATEIGSGLGLKSRGIEHTEQGGYKKGVSCEVCRGDSAHLKRGGARQPRTKLAEPRHSLARQTLPRWAEVLSEFSLHF